MQRPHQLYTNHQHKMVGDFAEKHGYEDIRYGVLAAQKGRLTATKNLSSFSLREFEDYLMEVRREKGI